MIPSQSPEVESNKQNLPFSVEEARAPDKGPGFSQQRNHTISSSHSGFVGSEVAPDGDPGKPMDFEKALRYYLKQRDEEGIKSRQLGIAFEDLRVVGLGTSASFQPTLGSILNPLNIFSKFHTLRHPPLRDILSEFEGVVRPGEMLLVLGRQNSGCSTLLKALACQCEEFYSIDGHIYYDSLTPEQISKRYRGDVQYCPEDDIHFPTLTADQTVHFAAKARAPQTRIAGVSRKEYTRKITDMYTTLFGLDRVKDTQVGDASIRGLSGGEKKRVSISEALATRSFITSWDNPTRGLDSKTALEVIRAFRVATDLLRNSTIVSLCQAGEPLFQTFDKVCVIYEGRMAYFGPANLARQYFIDMGYVPANRQTTPDFLVSVTDPLNRTLASKINDMRSEDKRNRPIPKTAIEFEAYYKNSEIRQLNQKDIAMYKRDNVDNPEIAHLFAEIAKDEHARHTLRQTPYMISIPMQMRIIMTRRMEIMKANFTSQALSTTSFVLQAIIVGTTFIKIPDSTAAYPARCGILFLSVLIPMLFTLAEIPALYAQRPIIMRHQKAAMYHPMVEAIAMTLVDIPFTLGTILVFTIIIYFIVQLQQSAAQYFTYFVFVLAFTLTMKAFFRATAAAFRTEASAQGLAGIVLLVLSLYTGCQIPRASVIGALRWISYVTPIFYTIEGLMVNEFHTLDGVCSTVVPSGLGYEDISPSNQVCAVPGSEPGIARVPGDAYVALSEGYLYQHLWRDFGIVVAFGIGFLICFILFSEIHIGYPSEGPALMFKRGARFLTKVKAPGRDEEDNAGTSSPPIVELEQNSTDADEKLNRHPKMANTFTWRHISYTVTVSGDKHRVLDDISGFVAPGKLTALMGESGVGKTSLLNVLAERVDTGIIMGQRFFNGQALPIDFQAQTGYCQQMDIHVPTTTVREALQFSARLRQPFSVPTSEKDAYAEQCLKLCGLEAFGDAMVGSLNVEQKKRTTIGVELAAKPKHMLFLDEPTSGLDCQSALAIISFLRRLADSGQAILCTIHQPSAKLFSAFDKLLLLHKSGKTVYFGDVGQDAQNIIDYFEACGGRKCGTGENPAEYILDVIGAGATAVSDRDWHKAWLESQNCKELEDTIEDIHKEGRKCPPVGVTVKTEFATSWAFQTRTLLKRQCLAYWREPVYLLSKLGLNIISALIIGFTFFKSKDSIQENHNKLFAIFIATIISAPLGAQLHVPYMKTRDVYEIRERSTKMYHWSALAITQVVMELPWNILGSSLFFLCWFWTVGFPTSRAGFTYLVYGVCFPIYYTTIALAIASTSPTADIAGLMFSFLCAFNFTFNGIIQPFAQLGWWKWMYHLSPFTYLLGALVEQAIRHQQIVCSPKELLVVQPPSGQTCGNFMARYVSANGGYLNNLNATSDCEFCPFRTTDQWLGPALNIYYSHRWRDFGIFCGFIGFNIFLFYLLTYLVRVRYHRHISHACWRSSAE
ncbi:hypothetical protein GALMADRAFT_80815 [Galerina marginata CBS 339.88]|uniref:ABC transporter domain-containing protein n=1 Tax=Galerina marginata (strain CBS 339.88) TaxID=685588 RepID=A0A067SI43_GALM3|nr:hypothetical protein GALMADRAFT_80815 [Galerina marginata CBS 339.88]